MAEPVIHGIDADPVEKRETELVERKGLGHPDSISDGVAEEVSRALSREYRERFGKVLHHNTDEVQLVAGSSNPGFGGASSASGEAALRGNRSENPAGEVINPIFMLLAGRATREFQGEEIPVDRIALDAAKSYIEENFQALEPDHVELESRIGETSTDLGAIFGEEKRKANDTSFGVGHAPLSDAERAVKKIESSLRREIDAVGEDVKVMGLRKEDRLNVTVASAVIGGEVDDLEEYLATVGKVKQLTEEAVRDSTALEPEVDVNTADETAEDSVYLTVTGTSAEMGDDGSVGRGNRVNGLITPHRSMSLEAASGKNPVTHVGKIYNLLADEIAGEIYRRTGEFAEVKLLSQIGAPVDEPQAVEVETPADKSAVEEVVDRKFGSIDRVTGKCLKGEVSTF